MVSLSRRISGFDGGCSFRRAIFFVVASRIFCPCSSTSFPNRNYSSHSIKLKLNKINEIELNSKKSKIKKVNVK